MKTADPPPPRLFVYFDATYTLLHPRGTIGGAYARVAAEFGTHADPAALESGFRLAWRRLKQSHPAHPEVPYGITQTQSRQFWGRVVEATFAEAGVALPARTADFQRRLFDAFATWECWELDDSAPAALSRLAAAGVPWGILSNWDGRLHRLVADWPLPDHRPCVVLSSSQAGHEKPHPAIYARAARLAGPAERLALIGDEAENDVAAPRAAGWVAVRVEGRGGLVAAVETVLGEAGISSS